ncbi:MAG: DNA polymerase III subunit gamma/tau [Candidatus Azobacteroides sp.]|nr:DNA polymerase III subunit gamma/tau [Candidatus Azobacteroides sp.]
MDNYIVSARKYRPSTFRSVIGQKALTTTLKNAIANNKLAHAYLFCGPRGVGKTTCARIFAKTINCLDLTPEGEACNQCESCKAFNEQRSYNIHELDAASNNSVDDIRSLVEQVRIPPQIGKYKVYIIDEVHMLSTGAFNAFLKTLEEPPKHAIFILATTEKYKILATILSRCQIYDFNRISVTDTVEHLQYVASHENVDVEPEALTVIAQKADGGMRDALSIFDQVVSFTGGNVTYNAVIENLNVLDYEYYFRLTDAFLAGNIPGSLLIFDEVLNKGFEGYHFITGLSSHFRDLLVCKDEATLVLLEVGAGIREKYKKQAQSCSIPVLYQSLEISNDAELNYRQSKNKRLLIELALIRLCRLSGNNPPSGGEKPTVEKVQAQSGTVAASPSISATPPIQNRPQAQTAVPSQPSISQPAVETKQPANPAPASHSRTRPSTISLKDAAQENRAQEPGTVKEKPAITDNAYTDEALIASWKEYANALPAERQQLKNTMASCIPQPLLKDLYEVIVLNQVQVNELNNEMAGILSFMYKSLSNNQFKITLREREYRENRKPFSKSEQFAMMQKKNPALSQLKDIFGLEIN